MAYEKFRPQISPRDAPFWEGVRAHQLRLQRCDDCGRFRFIPGEMCPGCYSAAATWTEVSGRGRVYTYTVVHRAPTPAYQADAPYVIAHVELDEGPRIISTLVDCAVEEVSVGMPVEVGYEEADADLTLYHFRPRR